MTTKTNESEQEVVIGNKQLLGIFFVVVVLLSVFFTMGYIIGRNTASANAPQTAAAPSVSPQDAPAERREPVPRPIERESARPLTPAPAPAVDNTPRTRPPEPDTTAGSGAAAPAATAAEPETHAGSTLKAIPEGDLYLQVAAIPRADAETERKVLRERGFPTLIGESSKPGLFRVLVGPFKDMQALHISKDELKKAGFESFVVK